MDVERVGNSQFIKLTSDDIYAERQIIRTSAIVRITEKQPDHCYIYLTGGAVVRAHASVNDMFQLLSNIEKGL